VALWIATFEQSVNEFVSGCQSISVTQTIVDRIQDFRADAGTKPVGAQKLKLLANIRDLRWGCGQDVLRHDGTNIQFQTGTLVIDPSRPPRHSLRHQACSPVSANPGIPSGDLAAASPSMRA
jgi:hypothetical protein